MCVQVATQQVKQPREDTGESQRRDKETKTQKGIVPIVYFVHINNDVRNRNRNPYKNIYLFPFLNTYADSTIGIFSRPWHGLCSHCVVQQNLCLFLHDRNLQCLVFW